MYVLHMLKSNEYIVKWSVRNIDFSQCFFDYLHQSSNHLKQILNCLRVKLMLCESILFKFGVVKSIGILLEKNWI